MGIMTGKKGIIFGVSNTKGIAYGVAQAMFDEGAEIAFTYANEAMEKRMECDITDEAKIAEVFKEYEKTYGQLDFVVHAIAFANREDLTGEFINTSKAGWDLAMGISAYSLVSLARNARPYMKNGGSIFALTYLGSEKVVANYNIMAIAKSALESSMRYLADNLGKDNIRVNCISAGPVKTLASSAVGGINNMLHTAVLKAPLNRNVTIEDIGKTGVYLASDLSTGVTGEVIHVDCGCHSVYASIDEMDAMTQGLQSSAQNND